MPENMRGTLASSNYNFAHTLSLIENIYKQSAVAIVEHLESPKRINFNCIVAFSHDLLKAFVYGKTPSICCSTTMKPLPLSNIYVKILSEP